MAMQLEIMPKTPREILERRAEFTTLADKAQRVLGYSGLVSATVIKPLKEALEELGVLIFTPDSVRRYQEQAVRRQERGQRVGRALIRLIGLCLVGIVAWWCVVHGNWLAKIGGFFVSALFWVVCLVITEARKEFFWDRTPIADYQLPVPCDALEKAIMIKERLPKVAFSIEELKERQRPRLYDPFLIAKLNNDEYYIDVWNEPGFERIGETIIPIQSTV